MAYFDQGFTYQLVYEVGGFKGRGLYVDGSEMNDRENHSSNQIKTKFVLTLYTDGTYTIKVANGQFAGWYLGEISHPKKKNIYFLVITPTLNSQSYWYFDQVPKYQWDKRKIIIRNKYYNNYLKSTGQGWKRNDNSHYPYCHPGNRVGQTWASWRIQQSGGTSTAQSQLCQQKIQIQELKQKLAAIQNDSNYYQKANNSIALQINEGNKNYESQKAVLENKRTRLIQLNKTLQNQYNILKERKDVYQNFKSQTQKQKLQLQQTLAILQNQRQVLVNLRQEKQASLLQTQNRIQQKAKQISIARQYSNPNSTIFIRSSKLILNEYKLLVQKYTQTIELIKLALKQNDQLENAQLQLAKKSSQNILLKQAINNLEVTNNNLINQKQQFNTKQETSTSKIQSQLVRRRERTSRLISSINKIKHQIEKQTKKSTYYKFLYREQLNLPKNQQNQGNKYHFEQENIKLRQRIEFIQQILREKDIQLPAYKEQIIEQEEETNIIVDQNLKEQNDQDEEKNQLNKKMYFFSARDRALNKLYSIKPSQILKTKTDDLDKQYEKVEKLYIKLRQKNQQNPYHYLPKIFDEKLTNAQIQINQTKYTIKNIKNDQNLRVGITNKVFSTYDQQIFCKINNIGTMVGIGVYNTKILKQQHLQTIGSFVPDKHQFYMLSSDGRFISNDGYTVSRNFTNLKFNNNDLIKIKWHFQTKTINVQIQNEQRTKKMSDKFQIQLFKPNQLFFAVVMKGKGCELKVVEYQQNLYQGNQNNYYSSYYPHGSFSYPVQSHNQDKNEISSQQDSEQPNQNQLNLLCQLSNKLQLKKVSQDHTIECSACDKQITKQSYCCNDKNCFTNCICKQCIKKISRRQKKLNALQKSCDNCSNQYKLISCGTHCRKCLTHQVWPNYYLNSRLFCQSCSYYICYSCAIK